MDTTEGFDALRRTNVARAVARTAYDRWLAASIALCFWCLPAALVAFVLLRGGYTRIAAGDLDAALRRFPVVRAWVLGSFALATVFWTWTTGTTVRELVSMWGAL